MAAPCSLSKQVKQHSLFEVILHKYTAPWPKTMLMHYFWMLQNLTALKPSKQHHATSSHYPTLSNTIFNYFSSTAKTSVPQSLTPPVKTKLQANIVSSTLSPLHTKCPTTQPLEVHRTCHQRLSRYHLHHVHLSHHH